MKIDEISKLELPNLFGKFLVVETISDGYTGTVSGHYNYEIDQKSEETYIYPVFWNDKLNKFIRSDELVVYTNKNKVYYVCKTTIDPYNHAVVDELTVGEGMDKDKRTLQAFKLFVNDLFSFGSYNIFLTGNLSLENNPDIVLVSSVSLDKQTAKMYTERTLELTATVLPEGATNKKVSFSVDKPELLGLTVSDNKATVTSKDKAGTAIVTVTTEDGEHTDKCTVQIEEYIKVTGINVSGESALEKGKTYKFTASIVPDNATNPKFTWSSSSDTIASVNASGDVVALALGEADIIATTEEGSHVGKVHVTVSDPEPVEPTE